MLEVSTSGSNTGAKAFTPMVDGVVDQTALQIVYILELYLLNSVLYNDPDLVFDRIKVWAIRRTQIWLDECRYVTFQETDGVTCPVCRGTVLLKN